MGPKTGWTGTLDQGNRLHLTAVGQVAGIYFGRDPESSSEPTVAAGCREAAEDVAGDGGGLGRESAGGRGVRVGISAPSR